MLVVYLNYPESNKTIAKLEEPRRRWNRETYACRHLYTYTPYSNYTADCILHTIVVPYSHLRHGLPNLRQIGIKYTSHRIDSTHTSQLEASKQGIQYNTQDIGEEGQRTKELKVFKDYLSSNAPP